MRGRYCIVTLALTMLTGLILDSAYAVPRRRRSYTYYSTSASVVRVAQKTDDSSSEYDELRVYYDYDQANAREAAFDDKIRVFLRICDDAILSQNERLIAEVKITDASKSKTTHVAWCPVSVTRNSDEETTAVFDVNNKRIGATVIQPAKVYWLYINLHRKSTQYGRASAIGKISTPYYVATSGPTTVDQGRRQIAMRTFKEWYYTERGWPSDENYRMDCHAYYRWATGTCTVGATNGWANLDRLFHAENPYHAGNDVPTLAEKGPIHGDYVRIPGHTFMLLAYDPETKHVLTMEGNYGGSIEIVHRVIESRWTVGHLDPEHIQEDLFVANDGMNAGRTVAMGERMDIEEPTATP